MKKKFLIFLSVFLLVSFVFLLTKGVLNRSHQLTKNQTTSNDLKKDNHNQNNQNNKVENDKETAVKEFKSDEVFGNSHYFEISIFFLAPVINLIVQTLKFKKEKKEEIEKNFCQSFILFHFLFSFVIAEFIINHLGGSLYRYAKSKKYSFLTIFKNSLKRRLRIITLAFLLVHFVFAILLFWIGYVCLI